MEPSIATSLASLRRTPVILKETLAGRPEEWLDQRHAQDVLSPREVVGHLLQGEEEDWIPRAQIILEHGVSRPFTPFDPYRYQEYSNTTPVVEMLAKFEELRERNLVTIAEIASEPHNLDLLGTHPRNGQVSMRNLVHTWAAHDLYHLGQIYKSFSVFYLDKIGNWQGSLNLPHFN